MDGNRELSGKKFWILRRLRRREITLYQEWFLFFFLSSKTNEIKGKGYGGIT